MTTLVQEYCLGSNGIDGVARVKAIESQLEIEWKGSKHLVSIQNHRDGTVVFHIDGRVFSAHAEIEKEDVVIYRRAHAERFRIVDARHQKMKSLTGAKTAGGPEIVNAPMPGKVVKILVKANEKVTQGQGLVVVEAMKMENELKSPIEGVVTLIHKQEGQNVENGTALITVAPK